MTISTTTIKDSYAGNGSTSAFTYNFKIADDDDIQVIIRAANGTETVKTKTTHYTVSGVGNNSGTVTFTAGNIPISTQTVILRRSTPQTQELDLIENDPLPANSIETAYDKLTQISQELQEQIDRSIKLSRTNTITTTEFTVGSADRANKILAFDANGEIAVTQELGTYRGNWATATSYNGRDLVKDTSNNNIYIVNTAHTSSGAQPLSSNANTAYYTLLVDAASATSSASAASSSAAAASASETAAASSAAAASSSASSASSSASAASSSASASAASAASAATSYDDFDDRYLGSKSSAPTLDNDGNALINGALYWNSVSAQMFVRDSGAWVAIKPTTVEQGNITTVAGISGNITTVAGISANVTSVAGNSSNINSVASNSANINTVATNNANINTVAGANANITTLAGISADITTVASNAGNISTVATDIAKVITAANDLNEATSEIEVVANAIANVDTVGTNIANVNLVGGSIANVNTVASNIGTVNDFGNRYRVSATAPTTSLDLGDLYFDTTSNTMKVYSSGGFINAGSSVNGTADRYKYTATASQTTFTGADDNSNTLAYDAGFLDVYLNGIKLVNGSDFTASSGTSIVLTTGASASDILEVIAYGTFQLANFSITDANDVPNSLGTAGQVLKVNSGATALEFGTIDLTNLNATNLTSGTLPDARFPATLPATSGANLTSLNASNLSSGTVPDARLTGITTTHALGSASTPSITFSGDTNTGIFSPTADTISFSQNGTEQVKINSDGLHISGTKSLKVPVGTTAERPATAVAGMTRYNTTLNLYEIYTGAKWSFVPPTQALLVDLSTSTVTSTTNTTFRTMHSYSFSWSSGIPKVLSIGFTGWNASGANYWGWRLFNSTKSSAVPILSSQVPLSESISAGHGIAFFGTPHNASAQPYVVFDLSDSDSGDTLQIQMSNMTGGSGSNITSSTQQLNFQNVKIWRGIVLGLHSTTYYGA